MSATKILTISGREIDPFNMTVDDLDIADIAHSLSMQCRYAGHIPHFYSVAEHCVQAVYLFCYVSGMSQEELRGDLTARSILLHDADEAYVQDLVSPIKNRPELRPYVEAGSRIHDLVAEKYSCLPLDADGNHMEVVRKYDGYAYEQEREHVRTGASSGMSPAEARTAFLGMWYLLRPSTFG